MAYEFRPAVRDKTSVLLALAGASGSGKTYTAILMAFGLAYPGMSNDQILAAIEAEGRSRVCFVDTEGGRGKHYAPGPGVVPDFVNTFPFDYGEITAPYTPEAYQERVIDADRAGYDVIIVDSMSHEYESEGGIQEIADQIEEGVLKPGKTKADAEDRSNGWKAWAIKPVKSPGNWKEPKTRHKKMVNRMIQARAHIIFCLRAEEKMLMRRVKKVDGNKEWFETEIIAAADRPLLERWQPICEKRFMYEMTASFLLLPGSPGIGHPIKNLQAQFQPIFPEGQRLGRPNGEALAGWSHGRKAGADRDRLEANPSTGLVQRTETAAEEERRKRTPEEMVSDYEIKVGKFKTLEDLQTFQAAPATIKFVDGVRAKHPDLHPRLVRANTAAYERLSAEQPVEDEEDLTLPSDPALFGDD